MPYETVIGLEVHAQLSTRSKIFCAADAAFGGPPNAHTCTVDLGLPGVLPVLNRRAVEYTLRLGLAVGGEIAPRCRFARKHYFYPDLPKGYQISQYEEPICRGGEVRILPKGGGERRVRLTRIHMEEDAGKLIHGEELGDPFHSYVDFNRAGVPLLEIVTEPDLRSPEEAEAFLRKLRTLVRYLGICDGNMQEGSLRCDANISLRPRGSEKLGAKVEIKNMNSFRHLRRALEHEEARQREALDAGRPIPQETRLWNDAQGVTIGMRSKEYAHDYRYFPEPDLVPLAVGREWLEEIQKSLPELPDARRARFVADYGLPAYDAEVLTEERALADYYEAAVRAFAGPAGARRGDSGSPRGRRVLAGPGRRDGPDGGAAQAPDDVRELRATGLDIDRHREKSVDERDRVGAGVLGRAGEGGDIGHVGRKLRDDRQRRHFLDRADDVVGARQAAAKRDAALLDVRARNVQLERAHAVGIREDPCQLDIFIERAAADVDEDRGAAIAQLRQLFPDEPMDADALEADGVEHAGRRLHDALRRMALALSQEEALDCHAAEERQVDDVGVLDAVAKAAAGSDDGVFQRQRADLDGEVRGQWASHAI